MRNTDTTTSTATRAPHIARRLAACAVALLPLALAGCGGGGTSGPASSNSAPAAPTPVLSAAAALPDGLTATLAESSATVASGGSVTYTLTLTNNTAQPVTFVDALNPDGSGTLPGVIGEIADAQGNILYPPPAGPEPVGPVAAAPTTTYTLPPLHSLSMAISLSFPYPAGRYTTTADFQTLPTPTSPFQNTPVALAVIVQ